MDIRSLRAPIAASVLLCSCTVCVTGAVAQERLVLPAPTGLQVVGRTTFHWIDVNRPEVLSGRPDDKREVAVRVWYPALPA
jgi:predicted dienelactone hydrolase